MTTVVVARVFRGACLFLTSSLPMEFTWSANRALAMPVSVDVAKRIIADCEDFERGTAAFAIDRDGSVIVPAGSAVDALAEPRKLVWYIRRDGNLVRPRMFLTAAMDFQPDSALIRYFANRAEALNVAASLKSQYTALRLCCSLQTREVS